MHSPAAIVDDLQDLPALNDPAVVRKPTAWEWAAHLLMLTATAVTGLVGCGLAGLVVWASGRVWQEIQRSVAWSPIDSWWMVPLALAVAAFSFAVPIVCAVGVYRRARRGPLRPPNGDEAGNLRGAVVRRGRGLMLGLLCLPLVGLCLWTGYLFATEWLRGRFDVAESAVDPVFWVLLGIYSFMIFTSALGLASAVRTVFAPAPSPPPGGSWESP